MRRRGRSFGGFNRTPTTDRPDNRIFTLGRILFCFCHNSLYTLVMAKEIKTVTKVVGDAEWRSVGLQFNRGDIQATLSVAGRSAWLTKTARYVYAEHAGYVIDKQRPTLPHGQQYWEITVDGGAMIGKLFEC